MKTADKIAGIFRKYILYNNNITNCLLITMSPDILMRKEKKHSRVTKTQKEVDR